MQSASCFPFTHSPWVEHPTLVLDGSPIFLFNPPLCGHHWVYMHTPASSSSIVSTPVPALHASICETDLTKPLPPACSSSHIPLQPSKDIRNIHKHKYVTVLTDAVIRSLCVTHSLPYHPVLVFVILVIPHMLPPFKISEETVAKPVLV